ncbi:NAD(P)/FAD-dependent oxidoreductase [Humidisolicoccus flavus]|uniref:NAD(P)/FAD-dependent oxidoreductase n=1 Tax=Humidisolicoccus flavus TaxID=3111414 RepID=UPI0032564FED
MSHFNTPRSHIAVLGGGILGVSTAVHALREGASVVLVTAEGLASGASGRSLSWLNSAGVRSDAYHALRVTGIDRYRTLFARDPESDWLRFDGGVYWMRNEAAERLQQRHEYEHGHAYESHLVQAADLPSEVGTVRKDAVSGAAIVNPGEGWVSLPHLIDFLMEEFDRLGGTLVTNAGISTVQIEAGRATGIITADGTVHPAEAVLVACGAWTPQVMERLGITIPDGSPLSMLVVTEPAEHGLKSVLNTPRAAVRPNPESTLAIDHDWYEEQIVEDEHGNATIDESAVHELVQEAARLIDGTPELVPASWKLGRKPIPGDGEPVLGEVAKLPGCYVAFSHSGATVGLIAGELLASELVSGKPHPMLAAFTPDRFSSDDATPEASPSAMVAPL